MLKAAIIALFMLSGCAARAQRDPFANLENSVSAIATLGEAWQPIAKVAPLVETSESGSISYRYDLGGAKLVHISAVNGKIAGFVLIDGAPDAEGLCKSAFKDRTNLAEGLARAMRETDQKSAALRYKAQIDSGLNKRLQVPTFDLPKIEIRAWAAINCRVSISKKI